MSDKPTLSALYARKLDIEDRIKICDPDDKWLYDKELALVEKDIEKLEKPARIEFSNNPPMGGA